LWWSEQGNPEDRWCRTALVFAFGLSVGKAFRLSAPSCRSGPFGQLSATDLLAVFVEQ
jgi:hypothetical protein